MPIFLSTDTRFECYVSGTRIIKLFASNFQYIHSIIINFYICLFCLIDLIENVNINF